MPGSFTTRRLDRFVETPKYPLSREDLDLSKGPKLPNRKHSVGEASWSSGRLDGPTAEFVPLPGGEYLGPSQARWGAWRDLGGTGMTLALL